MVCTLSPSAGTVTTATTSATATTSSSTWPTPTVSTMMTSKPACAASAIASCVVGARPPPDSRDAMLRMKTPRVTRVALHPDAIAEHGHRAYKGDDGSTAITATVSPPARNLSISRSTSVDFPSRRAGRADDERFRLPVFTCRQRRHGVVERCVAVLDCRDRTSQVAATEREPGSCEASP